MNAVDPFMTQKPEVLLKNDVQDNFDLAFSFTSKVLLHFLYFCVVNVYSTAAVSGDLSHCQFETYK